MTKLEKLRDKLAIEYSARRNSNPAMSTADYNSTKVEFCAGWAARDAIAKEREAKLVEALEKLQREGVYMSVQQGSQLIDKALADHKRMM